MKAIIEKVIDKCTDALTWALSSKTGIVVTAVLVILGVVKLVQIIL